MKTQKREVSFSKKMILETTPFMKTNYSTIYKAVIDDNHKSSENGLFYAVKTSQLPSHILHQEMQVTHMIENTSESSVVIPILFTINDDGQNYSILQFKQNGMFLNELIKKLENNYNGQIPMDLQLMIMNKILLSLTHIHHCLSDERGFLHLDIQPCNIFIENCDLENNTFGSAKYIDFQCSLETNIQGTSNKTTTGILFTEGYSAPEILDEDVDQLSYAADVFSVSAIFYRMLTGKPYTTYDDIDQLQLTNIPSIIEYKIKSVLSCGLETDINYRYASVSDILREIRQIEEIYVSYANTNYYNLLSAAYGCLVPKQKISAQSMAWNAAAFHQSCQHLEKDLLQSSINVRRCEYIFEGLWQLKEYYIDQISVTDTTILLSSGISIYNHQGNTTRSIQFYEELETYKDEIPILDYIKIINRIAVIYSDHYDYETAYRLIKENVEHLESLKKVFEVIAEKKLLPPEKVTLITDLGRAYSALGCYMTQLHMPDPMTYFLKAINEFGQQTGNIAITHSHILHYAVEIGGDEGKQLYEQYATSYFGSTTTPEGRYAYARDLIMDKFSQPFPMWIYLKGLLAYHKDDISKTLFEQLKTDFYNGIFNVSTPHPMPLIYRYIGLISYHMNGDNVDELTRDAFNKSLMSDISSIINTKKPLNAVMLINYDTLYQFNQLTDHTKENALLLQQLIDHATSSGWSNLADTLKKNSSLKHILEFEYC